ncbi:MAG: hypothetical protein AAF492_25815, partial [Verrucomicrobiota bacterium]
MLTGMGSIQANGGNTGCCGGGGGGGRIAIYYTDASGFSLDTNANVTVIRGTSTSGALFYGQNGTIYLENRTNAARVIRITPDSDVN